MKRARRALTAFLARLQYARRRKTCGHWRWAETTSIASGDREFVCLDCGLIEHGHAGVGR